MKKRLYKLTALFLTLTMALSLSLPAVAAENAAPPLISPAPAETASYLSWDDFLLQYVESHPQYYEAFDPDDWFTENYGWEEKEEFIQYMDLEDEAAFKEYMWWEYLDELSYSSSDDDPVYQEIDAAYDTYLVETYEARHPGELNKLKTEDLLVNWGYTKTLTPIEQFMEDQEITDRSKVRPYLLSDYAWNRLRAEDHHAESLSYQELYPEQWASFDDDAWFAEEYSYRFDSKQEYMDYYILLFEEEFRDDMFVDYVDPQSWIWGLLPWDQPQKVTLSVDGAVLEADIVLDGSVTYTDALTLNQILGTSLTGDRVPIRQAAEAAGWDVVWNPHRQQVFLYHRDSLPQGDFSQLDTLMNRLLSTIKTEKGQSYKTTQTTTLKLTAFNSLDGDKTASARITTELLQKDALYEYTLTVNAADLISLMPKSLVELANSWLEPQDLTSLLRSSRITVLLNAETGGIYFNVPILSLLDDSFTADTWLRLDAGQSLSLLADIGTLEWNTNDILYQTLLRSSAESYWDTSYYSYLQSQAVLGSLFGPQNFTEQGGTLTWSLNAQSLWGSLPEAAAAIFKEYEVTLSADRNGRITTDMALRLNTDALARLIMENSYDTSFFSNALTSWAVGLLDFRMESHASGTAARSSETSLFHWKNQFELETSSSSSRQKTSAIPKAAPPEDAEIIELF